jgi:hypothetical protein
MRNSETLLIAIAFPKYSYASESHEGINESAFGTAGLGNQRWLPVFQLRSSTLVKGRFTQLNLP